jgi:hypothetical protein
LFLTGSVFAHHSFAMFDQEHPMDLVGTVKEFKFTSPRTFILLEVKGSNETVIWNLEGEAPVRWYVTAGRARLCRLAPS